MPIRFLLALALAASAASAADPAPAPAQSGLPPGHPPIDQLAMPAPTHTGTVEEVIPAKPYVYLRVSENGQSLWMAAPEIEIKTGGQVRWADGMQMTNFQSKTLNRTFDKVLFVMQVEPVKAN
jgi:hypothetical protein